MDNMIKLSLKEAVSFFIYRDKETIGKHIDPSALNEECNISITCPTQRIGPDYKQDMIQLKNLISAAEKSLSSLLSKKDLALVMDRIKKAEQEIDFSRNKDGIIIYANKNFAGIVKVSIKLKPEVVIGRHFDSRPLYRANQHKRKYYIVTVSQQKIRLLLVEDNTLIYEITDGNFPFENTQYYTTDAKKLAQDTFEENLLKEFFNVADKRLQVYFSEDCMLPVILAGDIKSLAYFQEMMDNNDVVTNTFNGNFDSTSAHEIIQQAYPLIEEYIKDAQKGYYDKIEAARSSELTVQDYSEIYRNVSSGNIDTLYFNDSFSLKGKIKDNNLMIDNNAVMGEELTLDIISKAQENNGKIYFTDSDLIKDMVLIKRF